MKSIALSRAIKQVLAAQVGVCVMAVAPWASGEESGEVAVENDTLSYVNVKTRTKAETPGTMSGDSTLIGQSNSLAPNRLVQTVSGSELRRRNVVNVESGLNTLPQVISGFDRSSNNPGDGRATVDLRGLGPNRTAVLVNGRPFAPASAGNAVDLNNVPLALIKQVDIVTGGASAYGSGAMAGAVNFVIDENFQGAEFNVSHQLTGERDGAITSADLTLGLALAEGRGNVAIGVGGSERDAVFQGDRAFTAFPQFDDRDSNGNRVLINGGSSGVPGTSIFSGSFQNFSSSFGATFNRSGQIRPFDTEGDQTDFYNYAPVNYLQIPQSRKHVTVVGGFDFSDSSELYGLAMFSDTTTAREFAPTPVFATSTFTLDGSPFLTGASQQILSEALGDGVDSDGDGIDDTATAFLRSRPLVNGPRRFTLNSESRYVQAGFRGTVHSVLSYDVYASRAEVISSLAQEGSVNVSRFRQALLLDLEADPLGGICEQITSSSTNVGCVPANIFGEGNVSAAASRFLTSGLTDHLKRNQTVIGGQLTGRFAELSGGSLRVTLGAEGREDAVSSESVIDDQSDRAELLGGIGGVDINETTRSHAVYVGVYLPFLAAANDEPLFDLDLNYGLTDYETSSGVESFGAHVSWRPSERLKLRAGYDRSHRAPELSELYEPQTVWLQSYTEPCRFFGAGTAGLSPAQFARCVADGVPEDRLTTPRIMVQTRIPTVFGGNTDLQEERADSFTAGFESLTLVGQSARVLVGANYFDIDVTKGVEDFGGNASNVLQSCYIELKLEFCDAVYRRSDGSLERIEATTRNVAFSNVKGVDLFANLEWPARWGDLGFNFNVTFLDTHSRRSFQSDETLECAGKFGPQCGEPLPSYSHFLSANWAKGGVTFSLDWRHVGEVSDDDDRFTVARETLGTRDYLDAQVSWRLSPLLNVAFGIQNVGDVGAPVAGGNQQQSNTYPATYDVYGRSYFVRLTGSAAFGER